ncbi:MAG: DivIVA domain-containing protein, partial [candidate division NC10 bacterium]
MRITPIDIRQQQFTLKLFRGFDVQEVDAFLEDLANDYEELVKENALLKEQLAGLEERARGVTDREKMLQDTLVTTQRMVEEFKENGRREAQLVVREAAIQADKILEEARAEEAKIKNQILALKRARR